jgi:translation initiation factor eIF-2B subunit gamma
VKGEVLLFFTSTTSTNAYSSPRAKLEGCILGRNTKVAAKAELVRSLTQAGYEVETGGMFFLVRHVPHSYPLSVATIRNEKLEVSDWTAGPEGSSSEEESDGE